MGFYFRMGGQRSKRHGMLPVVYICSTEGDATSTVHTSMIRIEANILYPHLLLSVPTISLSVHGRQLY